MMDNNIKFKIDEIYCYVELGKLTTFIKQYLSKESFRIACENSPGLNAHYLNTIHSVAETMTNSLRIGKAESIRTSYAHDKHKSAQTVFALRHNPDRCYPYYCHDITELNALFTPIKEKIDDYLHSESIDKIYQFRDIYTKVINDIGNLLNLDNSMLLINKLLLVILLFHEWKTTEELLKITTNLQLGHKFQPDEFGSIIQRLVEHNILTCKENLYMLSPAGTLMIPCILESRIENKKGPCTTKEIEFIKTLYDHGEVDSIELVKQLTSIQIFSPAVQTILNAWLQDRLQDIIDNKNQMCSSTLLFFLTLANPDTARDKVKEIIHLTPIPDIFYTGLAKALLQITPDAILPTLLQLATNEYIHRIQSKQARPLIIDYSRIKQDPYNPSRICFPVALLTLIEATLKKQKPEFSFTLLADCLGHMLSTVFTHIQQVDYETFDFPKKRLIIDGTLKSTHNTICNLLLALLRKAVANSETCEILSNIMGNISKAITFEPYSATPDISTLIKNKANIIMPELKTLITENQHHYYFNFKVEQLTATLQHHTINTIQAINQANTNKSELNMLEQCIQGIEEIIESNEDYRIYRALIANLGNCIISNQAAKHAYLFLPEHEKVLQHLIQEFCKSFLDNEYGWAARLESYSKHIDNDMMNGAVLTRFLLHISITYPPQAMTVFKNLSNKFTCDSSPDDYYNDYLIRICGRLAFGILCGKNKETERELITLFTEWTKLPQETIASLRMELICQSLIDIGYSDGTKIHYANSNRPHKDLFGYVVENAIATKKLDLLNKCMEVILNDLTYKFALPKLIPALNQQNSTVWATRRWGVKPSKLKKFAESLNSQEVNVLLSNLRYVDDYVTEIDWILAPLIEKHYETVVQFLLNDYSQKQYSFEWLNKTITTLRTLPVETIMDLVFKKYHDQPDNECYPMIKNIYPEYFGTQNHQLHPNLENEKLKAITTHLIDHITDAPNYVIAMLSLGHNFLVYSNPVYIEFFQQYESNPELINALLKNLLKIPELIVGKNGLIEHYQNTANVCENWLHTPSINLSIKQIIQEFHADCLTVKQSEIAYVNSRDNAAILKFETGKKQH